jgi:hypothetical protein
MLYVAYDWYFGSWRKTLNLPQVSADIVASETATVAAAPAVPVLLATETADKGEKTEMDRESADHDD